MGIYNIYAGVQLKVADELTLESFKIGEAVDIPDGIYVGHDGFVVVQTGLLIAKRATITTTWGDEVKPEDILDKFHPLKAAIEKAKEGDADESAD